VPDGVLELFAIPDIRPDKILKLYREPGISSLAELEAAATEDRIRKVKGLGASLQTKILQNLKIARSGETQLHLHKAAALLEHAVATVKHQHPEYTRVEIAGDFRRGCELVTNLGLVAETKLSSDAEKPSGQLTLTVTDKKHFGASLLHATGSAEHLEQLAQLARKKGFQLKPEGLYGGKRLMASATENDIYKALDLQFIEPELREGRDDYPSHKAHAAEACERSGPPRHPSLSHNRIRWHRDAGRDGRGNARARLRIFWGCGSFHIRALRSGTVIRRDRPAASKGRSAE
jgi:DNA polymerase (family 10)